MARKMMVHCEARNQFGEKHDYKFFDEALIAHEGHKVLCYFDPHDDPCTAAIFSTDGRKLIARRATNLTPTPALILDGDHYREDSDLGYLERARAAKAAARAAVRREHRTLAPDGKIEAWSTEIRDAQTRARADMQRSAPPSPRIPAATVRPEPTDDDLAALERAERRAQQSGLIPVGAPPL
jgi:hypothetical protein